MRLLLIGIRLTWRTQPLSTKDIGKSAPKVGYFFPDMESKLEVALKIIKFLFFQGLNKWPTDLKTPLKHRAVYGMHPQCHSLVAQEKGCVFDWDHLQGHNGSSHPSWCALRGNAVDHGK